MTTRHTTAVRTVVSVTALALLVACSPDNDGQSSPPALPVESTPSASGPLDAPDPPVERDEPVADQPPPLAADAAELAERVVRAEDTTRDPASPADEVRAAAFEAQVLYRQLARRPGWLRRVVRAVPRRYRAVVRAHVSARRDFRSMHYTLSDRLPAWRIVEPAPAADLLASYRRAERDHGVSWTVLAAINLVETAMGRIRGTSVAGARGPMQFIPETWDRFGAGDINDPHDAIQAAARHLAHHGAAEGRLDRALYSYNNHPAYVRGVRAYAGVLEADPEGFRGIYHWQVVYLSTLGDVWLPVGYERHQPRPVERYVARHPERLLGTDTR